MCPKGNVLIMRAAVYICIIAKVIRHEVDCIRFMHYDIQA